MLAILIFAGRSTRFWPLPEKSFFEVAGTTLLREQVKRLKEAGFKDKDILLVGGEHNLTQAKKAFPKLKLVKQQDLDLGMRGALLSALPHCKKQSVLVVSANDMIESGAYRILKFKGEKKPDGGLILARKVKTYFPGGYLTVKKNRITGIVEKPGAEKEPSDLVNIVAHVHANAATLLEALKKTTHTKDDGYEQALDTLFQKEVYEAVPYTGAWQAVKYPWHLLDLLPSLLPENSKPRIPKSCAVHRTAVIEGSVILGENVRVLAHASIIGPCIIGDGTIVANNALVRGSSIGKRCVIGYNTEIARSILGDDVWTHSSYVGDSLLASDVSLAAGTVTGNLRLDEEPILSTVKSEKVPTHRKKFGAIIGSGCRTGIHTCLLPGVKIGQNSFISSGSIIGADIPDGSFLKDGTCRPNRIRTSADRASFHSNI